MTEMQEADPLDGPFWPILASRQATGNRRDGLFPRVHPQRRPSRDRRGKGVTGFLARLVVPSDPVTPDAGVEQVG
jgi:hypothetical protein